MKRPLHALPIDRWRMDSDEHDRHEVEGQVGDRVGTEWGQSGDRVGKE